MDVFIIDDEKMALLEAKRNIMQAFRKMKIPVDNLVATQSWKQALTLAKEMQPDIAFLDIQMPGMDGLKLGGEFQKINPMVNIIYVTAFDEYALKAFGMHASGYLMKPIDVDDVVRELNNLRHEKQENVEPKQFYVQCFGFFEVFYQEKAVSFRRKKAKELLAYLVHRKGEAASAEEICDAIFGNSENEAANKSSLRVLAMELKQVFESCNIPEAYIHSRNSYRIDPNQFECDYYDYLRQQTQRAAKYTGEYMKQYKEWAKLQDDYS